MESIAKRNSIFFPIILCKYLENNRRAKCEFIIPVISQRAILPPLFYTLGCKDTLRIYR